MYQRLPLLVSFEAKSFLTVPMRLHLLEKEGLSSFDFTLYFPDNLFTIRAVVGQEVNHAHGAGLAGVEISQPLGRRPLALPLLEIERGGGMQPVGRRG